MGVFAKLKNIFYDEMPLEDDITNDDELDKVNRIVEKKPKERVIEEKPKVEEIKYKTVSIPEDDDELPVEEEAPKTESTFSERDLFRSERTFDFVDFTDDEVEEPVLSRRNVLSEEAKIPRAETPIRTEVKEPKVFKPTPPISPIWGVLGKDYEKEDIKDKSVSTEKQLNPGITTYDTVRRKAYGTLEDELEDTLNSLDNKVTTETINKEINKVDRDMEILEQKTSKIEDLISKIEDATNEVSDEMTVGDLEDSVELENFEDEKEEVKEEKKVSDETLTDSSLEHDLFNLIDSMYDDKEE